MCAGRDLTRDIRSGAVEPSSLASLGPPQRGPTLSADTFISYNPHLSHTLICPCLSQINTFFTHNYLPKRVIVILFVRNNDYIKISCIKFLILKSLSEKITTLLFSYSSTLFLSVVVRIINKMSLCCSYWQNISFNNNDS